MSRAPDVESLRLLVLVGELGSLGRASAQLRIAQPSASKRMSTMESRLGLVLLDRSRRGSELTPAGKVVAGWANRVLTELDGLLTGAEALRSRRDAELRVAASMTLAEYFAPAWLGELRRSHPELYVGLQVSNSDHVVELVRAGEIDLGFVESPTVPRWLSSRKVAADRLVVVVAAAHPWAKRRRALSPAELVATPLVVREHGSGTRGTVERVLSDEGVGEVRPLVELGSAPSVRSAVIAGTGPAIISELAVAADLAEGRLVEVAVDGIEFTRVLRAVWPGGRKLVGPAAELLALATRRR